MPAGRYAHAASHITGTVFVMIGGSHDNFSQGDTWLCDFTTRKLNWTKVRKLMHCTTHSKKSLLSHVIKINNPGNLDCKKCL